MSLNAGREGGGRGWGGACLGEGAGEADAGGGLRYLSVCSGIEAASVAWEALGWEPVAFSEIEAFPGAVLAHHYPSVPNLGDMTRYKEWDIERGSVDLLVGGFPCQDLSAAGQRKGLVHEGTATRSGLFYKISGLADAIGCRWTVLENVPGILSSKRGMDFASVVGELAGAPVDIPDGGWKNSGCAVGPKGLVEWSVLDAQYFGVAQRRRRVFIVRDSGDWSNRPPILFERHSLSGNPAPRREAGKIAPTLSSSGAGVERTGNERTEADFLVMAHGQGNAEVCRDGEPSLTCNHEAPILAAPLMASGRGTARVGESRGQDTLVAQPLMAGGPVGGNQGGDVIVFEPRFARNGRGAPEEICPPLKAQSGTTGKGDSAPVVAFAQNSRDELREMAVAGALAASPGMKQTSYIRSSMAVRRLTPRECERLQGFPDDWTLIPWRKGMAPDGPRYKALGNSMAVPCMLWIGKRIQEVTK